MVLVIGAVGTSMPEGIAAVNISDLQKYDIDYPKEETEAWFYSRIFQSRYSNPREAEREVDRLEKMKIASLQKMFPRPGATTPRNPLRRILWAVENNDFQRCLFFVKE